jgi:putative transposase
MPRRPRLDAPGCLHHIIVRGIERREIFRDEQDRENFLTRLGEVLQDGEAKCFAWALMPNHAHILLRTATTPLARMMRRLLTGYAVSFNLRHQRSGHLFQNRYKSIVCEEDSYLLELVRYIHLNGIRAGLVKQMDQLDGYHWCGHSVLMGYEKRDWQTTEEVLSYFGRKRSYARRKYRQFVSEGISFGRREELTSGGNKGREEKIDGEMLVRSDPRVLGSDKFVEMLLASDDRMMRERNVLKRKKIGLEACLALVSKELGLTEEELIGGGRRRTVTVGRSVFCHLATRMLGATGRQLSEILQITPAAVLYSLVRGEKILREKSLLRERFNNYLNNLTTSP